MNLWMRTLRSRVSRKVFLVNINVSNIVNSVATSASSDDSESSDIVDRLSKEFTASQKAAPPPSSQAPSQSRKRKASPPQDITSSQAMKKAAHGKSSMAIYLNISIQRTGQGQGGSYEGVMCKGLDVTDLDERAGRAQLG